MTDTAPLSLWLDQEPEPDDGLVLIAGVLYDADTLEEAEPAEREPEPCPVRWSDTEDGYLMPCHLRAGHAGRHSL